MRRTIRTELGILLLAAILMALSPKAAAAADLRQGDTVTIRGGDTVTDDVYAAAGNVDVSGTVDGSLIASGGNVTVSGTVTRDLIVAAGTVTVTGSVRGSVRAATGTLTVSGEVGEDVVVFGGTLDVGSSGKIGRDLLVAGGRATVAGSVGRKLWASGGTLIIRGPVGGDVLASVDTLRLEDGAAVKGDLVYSSDNQASIASGAKVGGKIQRNPPDGRVQHRPTLAERVLEGIIGWIRGLVGLFALGLLLVLLFPRFSAATIRTFSISPWVSLGLGVALLIGVPIAALLVFVLGLLVGGWWLALIALGLYVVALLVAYVLAGLFVGWRGLELIGRSGVHPVVALLAGLILLTLIGLIPILGGLITLVACLFGLGALTVTLARSGGPASLATGPTGPV